MPESINQAVHSLREMNDRLCLCVGIFNDSFLLTIYRWPQMSKSKARSKALLIAFADLIPDMDKVVNKKLLDSLNIYSGHDNALLLLWMKMVQHNWTEFFEISFNAGSKAFCFFYLLSCGNAANSCQSNWLWKAYTLLKEAPAIPMFKTLADLDKF